MIFVDRSMGEPVVRALQMVRDDVIWLEDYYRSTTRDRTRDVVWLRDSGLQNWLVITRDKRIRYRKAEIRAIQENNVGCFVIGEKRDLSKWNLLRIVVCKMDSMEERFSQEERPFIYVIDAAGELRRVL